MKEKQIIREKFRNKVFERDGHKCKKCGQPSVDAHHITDRTLMPNGGYVLENGISLCEKCHLIAEQFHQTGKTEKGYYPDDLYVLINSNKHLAYKKSKGEYYCDFGFHGDCCCTCEYQIELNKHPWNQDKKYKGVVSESTKLWACVVEHDEYDGKTGTIHDNIVVVNYMYQEIQGK